MIQRIRMLKSVAAQWHFYPEGAVVKVPDDVSETTALSWLKARLAEEDKMIDRVPETKAASPVERPTKKSKRS